MNPAAACHSSAAAAGILACRSCRQAGSGRAGAATVTIAAVAGLLRAVDLVLKQLVIDHVPPYNAPVYTWLVSDGVHMQVGFLIDRLTALMMVVVTFVSLCVHVYTIGYMPMIRATSASSPTSRCSRSRC
jgi:NADH:ubiquinone oxidoreductase subunit 5 (subunit L)/multisubunit Na+/H+ antiporter MnhA subunit